MYYFIGAILGSIICYVVITLLTGELEGIIRLKFSLYIGIPLGTILGLLTVKMIKNDSNSGSKDIIILVSNALLYCIGGLIGSAGGFVAGNLLVHVIELSWSGELIILGIFTGGILGILLVKKIRGWSDNAKSN